MPDPLLAQLAAAIEGYEQHHPGHACKECLEAIIVAARKEERAKALAEVSEAIAKLPAAIVISHAEDRAIWRYHVLEAVDRLGGVEKEET